MSVESPIICSLNSENILKEFSKKKQENERIVIKGNNNGSFFIYIFGC